MHDGISETPEHNQVEQTQKRKIEKTIIQGANHRQGPGEKFNFTGGLKLSDKGDDQSEVFKQLPDWRNDFSKAAENSVAPFQYAQNLIEDRKLEERPPI